MKETINSAKEELKRVDHLFYVSLKYTKTVDVIRSIIKRIINVFEYSIDALLLHEKKKKKIKEIPDDPLSKALEIRKLYSDDEQFQQDIDLYILLRKIIKPKYSSAREFRKNVTMSTTLNDKKIDINIDVIKEYFDRAKNFVEKSYNSIHNITEE
jgi:hypothetical protein